MEYFRTIRQKFGQISYPSISLIPVLFFYSIFVLVVTIQTPIQRMGDGFEYLYMTQSFQRHGDPALTDKDISHVDSIIKKNIGVSNTTPYSGYYQANSGAYYSYHFWLYSLVNVPLKALMEKLRLNYLLAFQINNALFYLMALWSILLFAKLEEVRKKIILGVLAVGPVIGYLVWWHPEVFTFSLVVIALVFFTRGQYKFATFFTAIASAQNPPLLLLMLLFAFYNVITQLRGYFGVFFGGSGGRSTPEPPKNTPKSRYLLKNIISLGLAMIPAALPMIFYQIQFGTPNLIMAKGSAGLQFITLEKIFSLFFDLNNGILPYMPVLGISFFAGLIYAILKKKFMGIVWGVLIFLIVALTTQTNVWNGDSSGLARYAVWIVPMMVFYTLDALNPLAISFNLKPFIKSLWLVELTYQLIITLLLGGMIVNFSFLQMSPFAKVVLDNFSFLYSPVKQIFISRASRDPINQQVLTYYVSERGDITKILTDYPHLQQFRTLDNVFIKINDLNAFNQAETQLKNDPAIGYASFSPGQVQYLDKINLADVTLRNEISSDLPNQNAAPGETLKLNLSVKNTGNIAWLSRVPDSWFWVTYQWGDQNGQYFPGSQVPLPMIVGVGETVTVPLEVKVPQYKGKIEILFDVYWEGVKFFRQAGNDLYKITVDVKP